MRNRLLAFITLCLVGTMPLGNYLSAQTSNSAYAKGVELYSAKQYIAAQEEFRKALSEMTIDYDGNALRSQFYIALCASQLGQSDAEELLRGFIADHPTSIYVNDIHFALGRLMMDDGDNDVAFEHLLTVNPFELNSSQRDEYYFRMGYVSYQRGDIDKAYSHFKSCTSDPLYIPHSKYYQAYIDYSRDHLTAAKQGFSSIAMEPAYAPIIPFYLLQIEFKEGNYDYVIREGVPLIAKSTVSRDAEISRIVSEAYFHRNNYNEALKYINRYESRGGKMGNEELYLAGFCNRIEGNYSKAIEQLSVVAATDGEIGQNASFHLGDCFLKTGDHKRALSAFAVASRADFNREIKEESMFNYGKLQYEQGGGVFNEAINVLDTYVKNFSGSPRIDAARELLLAAYFNSRNYDAAYEAIGSIRNPDNSVKTALQKIAYFRALEHVEAGDYTKATELLAVADRNRFNPKYTALTQFWRGEILLRQGDYTKAIPFFKEYITLSPTSEYESKIANYNLGYCYFNTQKWDEAASYFDRFIAAYKTSDALRADGYNRLGDVAFARREYWKATEQYDQAIRLSLVPYVYYAQFQRAVMLGLVDRRDRKIESLQQIISADKGEWIDDAMYELGRTYIQAERFNDGAKTLSQLITRFPESSFNLSALSELGLTYQNLNNDSEALKYYKIVVDKFPSSPEAKNAMLGIRNIYVNRNDIDSYVSYANASGIETNITIVERDSLSFAAAQRIYQNGDYARALPLMDNYLHQYPRGAYRADALYALGDCSQKQGNPDGAIAAFEEVALMPGTPYKTSALQRLIKLQIAVGNHSAVADHSRTLALTATQAPIVVEALDNYLRSAVILGDEQRISKAIEEVQASPFVTDNLKNESNFAKAQLLYGKGDMSQALPLYQSLCKLRTEQGAESNYKVVSILFADKLYKDAESAVFEFAEQNSPYQSWTARAFMLLGDIYLLQDDAFQAKATYQSIVDGYSIQTDGIIEEAKAKLGKL